MSVGKGPEICGNCPSTNSNHDNPVEQLNERKSSLPILAKRDGREKSNGDLCPS